MESARMVHLAPIDYAIMAVLAVMVLSRLYQLIWLYTRVL